MTRIFSGIKPIGHLTLGRGLIHSLSRTRSLPGDRASAGRLKGAAVVAGAGGESGGEVLAHGHFAAEAGAAGDLGHGEVGALQQFLGYDAVGPGGEVVTADELWRASAVNLHAGGLAQGVRTAELV